MSAPTIEEVLELVRSIHVLVEETIDVAFDDECERKSIGCTDDCWDDDTCPGHTVKVFVCRECGTRSTGDGMATWAIGPCRTLDAIEEMLVDVVPRRIDAQVLWLFGRGER